MTKFNFNSACIYGAGAIPAASVIGCVVHASCSQQAPGCVQHHFGNTLIIGEPSGATTDLILCDELVTVVKELAMLTGVPTPFTDVLLGLSRLQARVRGLY